MASLLKVLIGAAVAVVTCLLHGCGSGGSDGFLGSGDHDGGDNSWREALLRPIFWNSNVPCMPYRSGFPTSRDCAGIANTIKNPLGQSFEGYGSFGTESEYDISIHASDALSVWDGFGTSLSWWTLAFGDRTDIADALFTLTDGVSINGSSLLVPGLGFNIARYNLGGSARDNRSSQGKYMYESEYALPKTLIEAYWQDGSSSDINSDSWDWTADAKQRSMLMMAKERGANLFELFSKSPVWWQTESQSPSGGSNSIDVTVVDGYPHGDGGFEENLRADQVDNHAHHMTQVAKYAQQQWNITFASVEPFNEPSAGVWHADGRQEGCWVGRQRQDTAVRALRSALDAAGLQEVSVAASDEPLANFAIETWYQFTSEAKEAVDRVNYHNYEFLAAPRDELFDVVSSSGKKLWQTEHGDGHRNGLFMAMNIQMDMLRARATGWSYWQAFDGNVGWGLFGMRDSWEAANKSILLEPEIKWWVLAHYSRHIRPGMTILRTSDITQEQIFFATRQRPDNNAPAVAAFDAASNKLVLVVVAFFDRDVSFQFSFDGFSPVTAWSTTNVTQWKTHAPPCEHDESACSTDGLYIRSNGPEIADGRVTLNVPKHVIITLEVDGIVRSVDP